MLTTVVGDVQCFFTILTVVSSSIYYPSIGNVTIDECPVIRTLEVICERYCNRQLLGKEANRCALTHLITAVLTEIEGIERVIGQTTDSLEGICNSKECFVSRFFCRCQRNSIFEGSTGSNRIPSEECAGSSNAIYSQAGRLHAVDLRDADVIHSSRSLRTATIVITPCKDEVIFACLNFQILCGVCVPLSADVLLRIAIQRNPIGRKSCSRESCRTSRTCCQILGSRNEGYTQVVIITFTVRFPIILEGVDSILEVEETSCINDSRATSSVSIVLTSVIGDIQSMLATIVCSGVNHPLVSERTVDQIPLDCTFEVFAEVRWVSRTHFGSERQLCTCTHATTAVVAEVEDIVGIIVLQTGHFHEGIRECDEGIISRFRKRIQCDSILEGCICCQSIPREYSAFERNAVNCQTGRHRAADLRDADVIDSSRFL